MLLVEDIHVYYGNIHALKGVSLEVGEGEIVTLIGANGAGKSTTLRAIAGLNPVQSGAIRYQGTDLAGASTPDRVGQGLVLCPEGRQIFANMSVAENLQIGAWLRRDRAGVQADIDRVYAMFPRLSERRQQRGGTLSGGEQQMLALGRALMSSPKLILLDEPSLGLAPKLVREVFDIIETINQQGKTVLLVEQNAYAALKIAAYAYVLEVGTVVLEGTGEQLIADSRVREAYLGG